MEVDEDCGEGECALHALQAGCSQRRINGGHAEDAEEGKGRKGEGERRGQASLRSAKKLTSPCALGKFLK